ncbi:MAG: autotransporter domain-containing protein [Hyphomonadaceae bacterium]
MAPRLAMALAAGAIAPLSVVLLSPTEAQACSITGSGTVNAPNSGDEVTCTTDDAVNILVFDPATITIGGSGSAVVSAQDNTLETIKLDGGGGSVVTIAAGGALTNDGQAGISLNGSHNNTINVAAGGSIITSGVPFGNAISMNTASDNTINIDGSISGVRGISISSGTGNVFNVTGSVTGTNGIAVFWGMFGGEDNTLINSGEINGDILTTDGNETVINSGTINGGAYLGNGTDQFELRAGYVISGMVRGGSGSDTLVLGGDDEAGFDLSSLGAGLQYDEFEALVQVGNATWTLTGASTFSGPLVTDDGGILLNGSLVNAQTQVFGGWLGGVGNAGQVSIGVAGFIRPGATTGASIGTLSVTDLNFQANAGGYVVDIAPDGSSDLISASGAATINGGTVMINPISASGYSAGTTYTIITASGGVTGAFSDLQLLDTPLIAGALTYDSSNVYFELLQVLGFADAAQTPNQLSVAEALDEILSSGGASADLDSAINALAVQPSGPLEAGLDDLAGQSNGDSYRFLTRLGSDFHRFVAASSRGAREGGRLWYGLYHYQDHQDGDVAAFGSDSTVIGGAIGLRLYQNERVTLGVAAGFSTGDVESDSQNDRAESDSLHLAGYVQGSANGFDWASGISVGFASLDTAREIAFLSETASGQTDALLFGISFDLAHPFAITEATTVSPYLTLEYYSADRDGYTETGAPGVNQILNGASDDITDVSVGARFAYHSEALVLSGNIGARRRLSELAPTFTAAFEGEPTAPFTIVGVEEPDLRALLGLEAEWRVNNSSSLRIGYDGAFGDGAALQSIRASMNMRF